MTGLKSMVGGELRYLTNMMYSARNHSVDRMLGEVMSRGGNAVIAMRFDVSEVMGFGQTCAYGTAVVVEKIEGDDQPSQASQAVQQALPVHQGQVPFQA
jgi:uncharacterized protein YbjQ (UPF0145 family)